MLKGKQKKLDKNNNGRIDAEDFKLLKADKPMKASTGKSVRGYGAARTFGTGLMDEQMAPGKVMNARVGKSIDKKAFMKTLGVFPKINKPGMGEAKEYKNYLRGLKKITDKTVGKKLLSPAYNVAVFDQKTYEKAGGKGKAVYKDYKGLGIKNEDEYFEKRNKAKSALKTAGKAAKATRLGKIALGIAGAGIAAKEYLKRKKEKKMGGGMIKRYSKGGGLDMGGPKGKIMQYIKEKKDDGTRLTKRDKEFVMEIMSKKKMGGGMMNKPMGYSKGGDGKIRDEYIYKQTVANTKAKGKSYTQPSDVKKTRREEYGAAKDRYPNNMDKKKKMLSNVAKIASPTMSVMKKTYDFITKPTSAKYSKGTMVMARGCKLGRKKATKLT